MESSLILRVGKPFESPIKIPVEITPEDDFGSDVSDQYSQAELNKWFNPDIGGVLIEDSIILRAPVVVRTLDVDKYVINESCSLICVDLLNYEVFMVIQSKTKKDAILTLKLIEGNSSRDVFDQWLDFHDELERI